MEMPIFLALLIFAGAVVYQYPESLTVTQGTNVSFQCDISELLGECTYVVWWHVGPLRKLTLWPQETYRSHTRKSVCLLNIPNANLTSVGTFYCAMINGAMLHIGNGSVLTISESFTAEPSLEVLVPTDLQGEWSSSVPLLCLVSGLDPSQATVYWEVEGNVQSSERLPDVLSEKAGSVRVQLSVPGHTWAEGAKVTCCLETSGGVRMNKTVSRTEMESSGPWVVLSISLGSMCMVLSIGLIIVTVYVCRLTHNPGMKKYEHNKDRAQGVTEVQYASLKFGAGCG
ncbi:hypothetical protein UPYG_G00149980 [Umbra pygmaea]|uniref:Ig-like domain-containing protein n=1 Tax=Umbra pygmaea TaxID=75934 RepID=A0ABD0WWZ8_UMBPY